MRERRDSMHMAGWLRAHELRGCDCTPEMIATAAIPTQQRTAGMTSHIAHNPEYSDIEPAQDGDVWPLRRYSPIVKANTGPIVGYGLVCPDAKCDQGVHGWDHAYNCQRRDDPAHLGCWAWAGTIAAGDLTGSPSLHVLTGCNWHGWLRNGAMVAA